MPGFVAMLTDNVVCSHAGQAKTPPMAARVMIKGTPVVVLLNQYVIAGCGLSTTTTPPCVNGLFTSGSTKVFVMIGGVPSALVVIPKNGTCTPTGQPLIAAVPGQKQVTAS